MGTGIAVEEDVYGSVAANQFTAEDGSYTDTIIASINY
jgi:spore coat protein U-like protein